MEGERARPAEEEEDGGCCGGEGEREVGLLLTRLADVLCCGCCRGDAPGRPRSTPKNRVGGGFFGTGEVVDGTAAGEALRRLAAGDVRVEGVLLSYGQRPSCEAFVGVMRPPVVRVEAAPRSIGCAPRTCGAGRAFSGLVAAGAGNASGA